MNNDKHQQGGDILKELRTLHDWHMKNYKATAKHKKKADHMTYAYLVSAAMTMISRQDEIIATRDKTITRLRADLDLNAVPFTDPNRKNTHAR